MATYPGMSLGGEVRESVSLDEDDLSDVEDEVFIRDGKNGYKFVEDAGLKRPLMAPRRKPGRPDIASRLKNRPPCKALCKPCCYVFGALFILIGLIALVVILVSMFPLPIDKIKSWIVSKAGENVTVKILPCSELKVTDVWTVSFPKFISESPIRAVDVNSDGVEDFIFGYGTALENALHPNLFCPIFMGVSPPCEGGVMALNGLTGKVLWKRWFLHSIFTIMCTVDINKDKIPDCIVTGKGGIMTALNSRDGTVIWTFEDSTKEESLILDVYTASAIPDQNKDGVADIIAAHTGQKDRQRNGHILLISGLDGKILKKLSTPGNEETYYMPQVFNSSLGSNLVLIGTGSPTSPGNLSIVSLESLAAGNMTAKTLYEDKFKGLMTSSVLVDITGDGQVDIITAAFNTTVIAFDGKTLAQIWNVTIPNSESLSVPIPGYFNSDNVTDFFIKYQTGKEFPLYYYSQAYIIDGRTGNPIYEKGIIDTLGSQMGGLTLSMELYGYDLFLYWIVNCAGYEGMQTPFQFNAGSTIKEQSNADLCKLRFNSTTVAKLFALNQFDQPPGIELYTSDNRTLLEFKNVRTAVEEAADYFRLHPENDFKTDTAQDVEEILNNRPSVPNNFEGNFNGGSSFRHKGNHQGLIKDFARPENKNKLNDHLKTLGNFNEDKKFEDYDQQGDWPAPNQYDMNEPPGQIYDLDNPYYGGSMYNNQNDQYLIQENMRKMANRDPRSKIENLNTKTPLELNDDITIAYIDPTASTDSEQSKKKPKTLKKNLSDNPHGIYGYKNIKLASNRLLHDLNSSPSEILRDTYFKNRERQLRKSRFEQRDIKSHKDKLKDNEEVKKIIEQEKAVAVNISENLWHLESEKEQEDRENGYWRNKRSANKTISWIPKITSIGVITDSIDKSPNSIDIVFLTYWLPPKNGAQVLLEEDIKCISDKLKESQSKGKAPYNDLRDFEEICLKHRLANSTKNANNNADKQLPYYNQILQLRMGQMTVYRLRVECKCEAYKKGERCAKFLPAENQSWSSYLGKLGDGFFGNH